MAAMNLPHQLESQRMDIEVIRSLVVRTDDCNVVDSFEHHIFAERPQSLRAARMAMVAPALGCGDEKAACEESP